jgi:hypothetical protein
VGGSFRGEAVLNASQFSVNPKMFAFDAELLYQSFHTSSQLRKHIPDRVTCLGYCAFEFELTTMPNTSLGLDSRIPSSKPLIDDARFLADVKNCRCGELSFSSDDSLVVPY